MPPFILTEAGIIAVANALEVLGRAHIATIEGMTPEMKATQSQFFNELLKGPMMLLHAYNEWLEKQLAK